MQHTKEKNNKEPALSFPNEVITMQNRKMKSELTMITEFGKFHLVYSSLTTVCWHLMLHSVESGFNLVLATVFCQLPWEYFIKYRLIAKEQMAFSRKPNTLKSIRLYNMWVNRSGHVGNTVYGHFHQTLSMLGKHQQTTVKIFCYFSQTIGSDISCKLSPWETICMTWQSLPCIFEQNEKLSSFCRLLNCPVKW